MTALEVLPLVRAVGGGFLAGIFIGYAIKIVIKFVGVRAGLFVAG